MNAIHLYRLGNYLFRKNVPFLPLLVKILIFLIFNSVVPFTATIGSKSRFAYGAIGVVIHGRSVIGERVVIGQGVTIGRQLDPDGVPRIGDNVYISAGARILGDIVIGDNVIIGANAVVISDIPSDCIAAGVPARVIRAVDNDIYQLLRNIDL